MKLCSELSPFPMGGAGLGQLAFDGDDYYACLFCQERVLQLDRDFHAKAYLTTVRSYDSLCFDSVACCFWATIAGSGSRLFQLDTQFREVGCLCLEGKYEGRISAISVHACHNSIFLAFPSAVVEFDKEGRELGKLPPLRGIVTAMMVLCPGCLVVTRQGKRQVLHIFFDHGCKLKEYPLPHDYSVKSLVYNPCCQQVPRIDCLVSELSCYLKVSHCPVTCYELGFTPCICNHKLCNACFCGEPCHGEQDCDSVTDVLESIAMLQASLSCILHAQGSELQKVVAESQSVADILEANCEINKTITKVTCLEQVLYCKLETLEQICPENPHKLPCGRPCKPCGKFSNQCIPTLPYGGRFSDCHDPF